jgi:selenide,water dikinase
MGPGDLADLLKLLKCALPPGEPHPDLIVPAEQGADAGVFRVAPDVAIVQSADFFPPMVADPGAFGRIAAANSLSDIYACGGRPVTAINLLAVPKDEPHASIVAILAGAEEVVREAGAVMVGGHTLLDDNIKFGLSVTGVVHPDLIVRHNTPRPDDALVLTKPLGTGVLITAHGKGQASDAELEACIRSMSALNRGAAQLLVEYGASASTDITGFGLIGHALDMLSLDRAGIEIDGGVLPLLPRVRELAAAGAICGGTKRNMAHYEAGVEYGLCGDGDRVILNDAQTSGGLLVALPASRAREYVQRLNTGQYDGADASLGIGVQVAIIGRVTAAHPGTIRVLCQ